MGTVYNEMTKTEKESAGDFLILSLCLCLKYLMT